MSLKFTVIDPIYNIAEICAGSGITEVIICPGSRSAPLTISFARHLGIRTRVVFDERSAAYIALGMAQRTRKTVVLVCTSGTAVLNFAPAVAEAYYQQIPLLVLTGDRPGEWIGQGDGQTIRQDAVFAQNIKRSYAMPVDRAHADALWAMNRILSEAIHACQSLPLGPVHVNIPVREPFYPKKDESWSYNTFTGVKNYPVHHTLSKEAWDEIIELLLRHNKKLIVAGQLLPDKKFNVVLNSFQEYNAIPLIADINSNLQHSLYAVLHSDCILNTNNQLLRKSLKPDLLITIGNEIVSKNLKKFLRETKPKVHIHIQDDERIIDPFQSITHKVVMTPHYFFNELINKSRLNADKLYLGQWQKLEQVIKDHLSGFAATQPFGEFQAVKSIIEAIPDSSVLHMGNSLPVRYATLFSSPKTINYCNRGTSGIDGSVSTAVGSAILSDELVTLITGDMSFFYDRNGLWHNHLPSNFRIIVLNNHGGGIFRTVEGAKEQPELEDYFVTHQLLTAQSAAKEFGLEYTQIKTLETLETALKSFFKNGNAPKLMEIETDSIINTNILSEYKNSCKVWLDQINTE